MKRWKQYFILGGLVFLLAGFTNDHKTKKEVRQQKGYGLGERFTYRVHFGFITAGEAVIEVSEKLHELEGRACYKADVYGKSKGMFHMMLPINDNWGAYVDPNTLLPVQSWRYLEEGRYRKYEVVDFKHQQEKVVIQHYQEAERENLKDSKDFPVKPGVHNMVSGAFFMRTLDYQNYQVGDTIHMPGYFDEEQYELKVLFEGKETIKTKAGKFNAVRLTPVLPDNKLFSGENAISFWFTDDEHKMPIKIKAEMLVGSVGIEMTDFELGEGLITTDQDKD